MGDTRSLDYGSYRVYGLQRITSGLLEFIGLRVSKNQACFGVPTQEGLYVVNKGIQNEGPSPNKAPAKRLPGTNNKSVLSQK